MGNWTVFRGWLTQSPVSSPDETGPALQDIKMVTDKSLEWVIDWGLSREEVKRRVDALIQQAVEGGKILCLPVQTHSGQAFHDLLALLLAQVHCGACDAPCCRQNPGDKPSYLVPSEYHRLVKKYGREHFPLDIEGAYLPMPCPFLENNWCTIYEDRPLVCVLYPFQPGAVDDGGNSMIALAANCPEARRITRQVFMSSWWIRHQFGLLEEATLKKEGGR